MTTFSATPDAPRSSPTRTGTAIDPQALMRIKSLELRARAAVEGFVRGIHRSPYHGFSVEFSEYRRYTPGDDPRHIDWRLYARSDRDYVKRFEDETNLRCTIVLDVSRSMTYGSGPYSKAEYARTAAATLAYFLTQQRDAVGLMTFEDRVVDVLPPRHRPGQFRRLLAMLQREPQGRATDLDGPLAEIAATVRRRALIVLFSDLLAPSESLRTRLGHLRARGHEVVLFRILDPAEVGFHFEAPATFLDVESGRVLDIDPEAARDDYLRRFESHAIGIARACDELGIGLSTVTTDRPLEFVLFDFLKARSRRGRRVGRRDAPGRGGGSWAS